ncbi:MAG: hypothetical protein DWQ20_00785 [Actinobacteria bacterium]|nr:MAG: hypothetical protein DWQ20_00785 [Actinomycetota bacterium]
MARTNDCLTLRWEGFTAGDEAWVLLTADRHLDSKLSDRKLQRQHLDLARERRAMVLDFGDLFDAMQGRDDRRGSKGSVIEAAQSDNYFNAIVNDAAEFLAPYADQMAMIGQGNHEQAVTNRHEICLRDSLIDLLRYKHGATSLHPGGYTGWVRFQFKIHTKLRSIKLWYAHGHGGGGAVTKGVIKSARRSEVIANADIVVSGHTHERYMVDRPRKWLKDSGAQEIRNQLHLNIPSYKANGAWEEANELPPKLPGAWWLRFYVKNSENGVIGIEPTPAR